MVDDGSGLDPLSEDARLRRLDERLQRAKHDAAVGRGEIPEGDGGASYRLGNRVLAELIGGMAGGAVIGFALDWLLGTSPWLLLVLLALGTAAAFRNIIRISSGRPK